MGRRWLVVAAFFVLTAGAFAQEIDLDGIDPGTLTAEGLRELQRDAFTAYNDGEYEAAARAYVLLLRRNPGDSSALYNLACCFGLLGRADQAAAFLEASWEAGFDDLDHIRGDRDFDSVRDSAAFKAVMVRLEEKAAEKERLRGKLLTVPMEMLGTVRVVEPNEIRPWMRYPLVIGLHGFGSNAESFAEIFTGRGVEQDFIFCSVRAPYGFPVGSKVGWSWGYMGAGAPRSAGIRSHVLTERYVLAVLRRMKEKYPIDERRVFLLGFSQGAGTAFTIGMRNPELFRGVIPIGGWLDDGSFDATHIERARKYGNFLVVHSPGDRTVEFAACEYSTGLLAREGIPFSLLTYEGGHSVPAVVSRWVADWIAAPEPGLRDGPEAAMLAYGYRRGESAVYRTKTETDVRSDTGGSQTRILQTDVARWKGTGPEEDDAFGVDIEYEHIRVQMSGAASGTHLYDSDGTLSEPRELPLEMRAAAALPGRTIHLVATSRGEVRNLSGYRAIYEDLVKEAPEMAALEPNFSDALRGRAMQMSLGRLPESAVAVGDTWTESFAIMIPSLGEGELELRFELAAVHVEAGRRRAVIRIEGRTEDPEWGTRPAAGVQSALTVQGIELEGEVTLDLYERKVEKSRRSLTLKLGISGQEVTTVTRTRSERIR